jgi:hypothetical protein
MISIFAVYCEDGSSMMNRNIGTLRFHATEHRSMNLHGLEQADLKKLIQISSIYEFSL